MGVLGWSPSEFWAATPNDLYAAQDGWREANAPPTGPAPGSRAPSKQRLDEMLTWVE